MQELSWLDSHIGSLDEGIELINNLHWNITITKVDDCWLVMGGDQVIFRGDTQEDVNAFIYGMALAYSVIPRSQLDRIREEFKP